jgi:ABC-type transporter Mla subunit MlaD
MDEGYVDARLFEAANRHVLEQGHYCNQLIGALNDQRGVIDRLTAEVAALTAELSTAKRDLEAARMTANRMRNAIYNRSESV